jgi:hypothetical protein
LSVNLRKIDADDPKRRVKKEVHEEVDCRFSPLELQRLSSIKEREEWLPAEDRAGYRPFEGFDPMKRKRKCLFYQNLLKEYDSRTEEERK